MSSVTRPNFSRKKREKWEGQVSDQGGMENGYLGNAFF